MSAEEGKLYIASPYDRFAAAVIDYFIVLLPVIYLAVAPFQRRIKEAVLVEDNIGLMVNVIGAVLAIISILITYQTVSTWLWQGTIGKLLLGLRIINVWTKRAPSLNESFFRSGIWILNFLLLGIPFLGNFSNHLRRSFHDKVSDTIVVSKHKAKAALAPGPRENALVSSFYWTFGLSAFLLLGVFISDAVVSLRQEAGLAAVLEREEVLCRAIGDALTDWPDENGDSPDRLSVALSLYFAAEIDRGCLEAELENLYKKVETAQVYLARSLVYEGHEELSSRYADRVCEISLDGEECALIQARSALRREEWAASRYLLGQLFRTEKAYISIWATGELTAIHDFAVAERFIEKVPTVPSLNNFLTPYKAKILWGLHRKDEALGIEATAFASLGLAARVDLAGWLCFEQIWNDCGKAQVPSCRIFSEAVEKYDDILSDYTASAAYLKRWECERPMKRDYAELIRRQLNPEIQRLVDALAENQTDGFSHLLEDESSSDAFAAEVSRRIAERTKSHGLLKVLTQEWAGKRYNLHWEKVGLTLLSRWYQLKDYHAALEVGDRLRQNLPSVPIDAAALESLILSAYRTGQMPRARGLLSEYMSSHPMPLMSSRAPASNNDFVKVIRDLLVSGEDK